MRKPSDVSLPPYQLHVPSNVDVNQVLYTDGRSNPNNRLGVITDNSPLLRISADSTLNNKISLGDKFNKRVKITRDDSPKQDYMGSTVDLSQPLD